MKDNGQWRETVTTADIVIRYLFISRGHNYKGRFGQEPHTHEMESQDSVECVAGKGIWGDRYFDHKPDYKGQMTFFADEVWSALCREFSVQSQPPSVFRRNAIVSGIDLNELIGKRFSLGEVEFEGVEEAKPCRWMNQAFCEGAEEAMRGRGGLRTRILCDGTLSLGKHSLVIESNT